MENQSFRCVIIGAGALGTHLALALQERKFSIVQVVSRSLASAEKLAKILGNVEATNSLHKLSPEAEVVFLCVSDNQLPEVVEDLRNFGVPNACFLHLAGSVSLRELRPLGKKIGVLYPLYTFSPSRKLLWQNIPLFLEASPAAAPIVAAIANALSPTHYWLTSPERLRLHLAAVFMANFVNHLASCSQTIIEPLKEKGVKLEVFFPLLEEVVDKLRSMSPDQAQTGPARRGDKNTLRKHRKILAKYWPDLQKIYQVMSDSLLQKYSSKYSSPSEPPLS
jgi:predicted short-subunit dehydrogenase-like oxidoreductase (DUF2520 family)